MPVCSGIPHSGTAGKLACIAAIALIVCCAPGSFDEIVMLTPVAVGVAVVVAVGTALGQFRI